MDEDTQKRVAYEVTVPCPVCGQDTTFEVTTEDDEEIQIVGCDTCGEAFVIRPQFYVDAEVYALKLQKRRRR